MGTTPDKTGRKEGRFQIGKSGNPSGRPKGTLNKTTLAIQALLDGEAEAITRKAIEMALGGDITAMRLVLERILPPRKEIPIQIELPSIHTTADAVRAIATVVNAVAASELTPSQGQAITTIIAELIRIVEVQDIAARIEALEQRVS